MVQSPSQCPKLAEEIPTCANTYANDECWTLGEEDPNCNDGDLCCFNGSDRSSILRPDLWVVPNPGIIQLKSKIWILCDTKIIKYQKHYNSFHMSQWPSGIGLRQILLVCKVLWD